MKERLQSKAAEAKDTARETALKCAALVDSLFANSAMVRSSVRSSETFSMVATPATAGSALKLIEEKGLELSEEILAQLTLKSAKRLQTIEIGHTFSRTSAQEICRENGGRLAYRRDLFDEETMACLVNDGQPYGGDKWIPVLDGDPMNEQEGIGWLQVGDPKRFGKNHKEAHEGDCQWGDIDGGRWGAEPSHKGQLLWCVSEEPVLASFALSKLPEAAKLMKLMLDKAPWQVPFAIVAVCKPLAASNALLSLIHI